MKERALINAETIGAAARYDPQLRVPRRPRLRRGLVITFETDQVLVEGTPKRQAFGGRSATELLPGLLDLLDGTREHALLADALGVPEEVIFKALSLLWTCGVIEEGPPAPGGSPGGSPREQADDSISETLADYLSRIGSSTEANPAWEQAADRLRAARVEVFGDASLGRALERELRRSLPIRWVESGPPREDTTLVVWIDAGRGHVDGPDRSGSDLAEHCWSKGIPLLRLRTSGRTAALGPFVDPRMTPCFGCLTAGDEVDGRAAADGDDALAVALFAHDLFAIVSRTTPVSLPTRWRWVDLETLAQQEASSSTRPGCPRCSIVDGPVAAQAALGTRFEASVAMPPKRFADLKAHQVHYRPSNLALQRVSRTWPVAPKVELPPPRYRRLSRRSDASPLDADALSLLLAVTAGVRAETDERVLRWTASGGNIGSVTAYVVVRDVPRIAPGVYGYVIAGHRLARLSSTPAGLAGDTPLTMVLSGDFAKVARKYSAFALRIVLLDSGCAQATLRAAASALGLRIGPRPRWDDDGIAATLGINPDMEPITGVIDIGGGQ